MDVIIFVMFCCLAMYICSIADKRYKTYEVNEDLLKENLELKKKLGE